MQWRRSRLMVGSDTRTKTCSVEKWLLSSSSGKGQDTGSCQRGCNEMNKSGLASYHVKHAGCQPTGQP